MFGYDNRLVFPIYISDQKFEDSMDLLFFINNNKSHYVYKKKKKKKKKYKKKLEIIFTQLINLEVLLIEIVM